MNLLIVAAVAFGVPFTLGLVPWLRLRAVALEIVAGIVIGPSVLGWVTVDEPLLLVRGLPALVFRRVADSPRLLSPPDCCRRRASASSSSSPSSAATST